MRPVLSMSFIGKGGASPLCGSSSRLNRSIGPVEVGNPSSPHVAELEMSIKSVANVQ